MIELSSYNAYFRDIAESHKRINGFLKLGTKDFDEAATAIRAGNFETGQNIMILENFEIKQKGPNIDQIFDIATGLFCVFQPINPRGDSNLDHIAQETLTLCRQIEARMYHDQRKPQYDFLKRLVTGSFEFEPTWAPVLSMYGWRVFFDFASDNRLVYNPEDWSDE